MSFSPLSNASRAPYQTIEHIRECSKHEKYNGLLTLSGGIDSTVMTHLLVRDGVSPLCVYVSYGSVAEYAELRAAEATCLELGLDLYVLDMGDLYKQLSQSVLLGNTEEKQEGSMFWLEGRNGLIAYMLGILASNLGVEDIYIGINASDSDGDYVDTSEQFVTSLNLFFMNSFRERVRLTAPWIESNMTKADIIELGTKEYHIDWVKFTHSCSSSGVAPCMDYLNCESCKYRQLDFHAADMLDPFDPSSLPEA